MINQDVFKDMWELLCDRFSHEPSSAVFMAYYANLKHEMTTVAFQRAAQIVFNEREFFPRPVDFTNAMKRDLEAEALEQWERVQKYGGGSDDAYRNLTAESKRVMDLVGGSSTLRAASAKELRFLRDEFMSLYGIAARIQEQKKHDELEAVPMAKELADELPEMP